MNMLFSQSSETIRINWINNPDFIISDMVQKQVEQWCCPKGQFGKAELYPKLVELIHLQTQMSEHQILSHRHWLLSSNNHLSSNINAELLTKYEEQATDIVQLATEYNAAPFSILRRIFSEKGWSKTSIKRILRCHEKSCLLLSNFDKEQILLARLHDMISCPDNYEQAEWAKTFERKILHHFLSLHVKLKTEQTMLEEQQIKFKQAVATPDILIDENTALYINDYRIKWIEIKNFYISNHPKRIKMLQTQINRYRDFFGPGVGAIVSSLGWHENVPRLLGKDVLLLTEAVVD